MIVFQLQTYIVTQDCRAVEFVFEESLLAFTCGKYTVEDETVPVLVYVTCTGKILIYYNISLPKGFQLFASFTMRRDTPTFICRLGHLKVSLYYPTSSLTSNKSFAFYTYILHLAGCLIPFVRNWIGSVRIKAFGATICWFKNYKYFYITKQSTLVSHVNAAKSTCSKLTFRELIWLVIKLQIYFRRRNENFAGEHDAEQNSPGHPWAYKIPPICTFSPEEICSTLIA